MLYPVFGLPGPLTDWCCQAIAKFLLAQGRPAQVVLLDTVEDLAVRLMEGHGSLIHLSHRPEQSLLSALRRAAVPIFVAAESPRQSFEFRIAAGGLDRLASVREVLADLAALQDMPRQQSVLVVSRTNVLDEPAMTLATMARHLGCTDSVGGAAEMASPERLASLMSPVPSRVAGTPLDSAKPVTVPPRDPVGDALQGMEDALTEEGQSRILIDPEFFIVTATGQAPSSTPLDATGRARGLVHGPYVCLARGDWIARCVHRYSEDLASASFVIDIVSFAGGSLQELARSSFKIPSSSGLVETTLQFRVESSRNPLEVRLFAERAIFNGEIKLGPVIFTRTDSSRSEAYPLKPI
jgi:hypothetical protein